MKPKADPVHDVAGAIADGSGIDWKQAETDMSESEYRRLLEPLRLISKIAGLHRAQDETLDRTRNLDRSGAPTPGAALAAPSAQSNRWGGLILIEEIGRGSFGTVYRAHDPQLDRPVALKLLRPVASGDGPHAATLLQEARILARMHHPNVVTVHGAGEHGGQVGIWMEFIRGLTLEEMLVSHGPFSAGEAALIGYELCGALAAVHHANLVHRDIKAQNVMREEGGRLVLMDFGAGGPRPEPGVVIGRIVGTPLYLAPEVLSGAAPTIVSDIYSLGVLLYHLVTRDFPVKGESLSDLISAHARKAKSAVYDLRPNLPQLFVRIVERAIDPDPGRRFASAGSMEAALTRILGATPNRPVAPRLRMSGRRARRATSDATTSRESMASVAVLPFSDMSPAKDQEYFCDGITEELINALTQIPGLRVAARTSAFQFKGQARDIRRIGEALDVATVLDGSVRKDGDRLRITAELIGSADGYHLWAERFDRQLLDVFSVQEEIAGAIVSTLKGRLAASTAAIVAPRSHDLKAYAFYLEGRYHWNKRTEGELQRSVHCFEKAIERDPEYAPAYGGIADAYVTLGTYGALAPTDVMPRAKQAIERGLSIDAGLAEAYACRGCVRSVYDWSWAEAEADFKRAIELKPSYPTAHHWYAINHLVPMRRFDEATEELHRALSLDPLALAIKTSLGMKCYFARQYEEAVRLLTGTIWLDEGFGMAHFFLGKTYTELRRFPEALEALENATRLSGRNPEILAALGYLHGVAGNIDGAQKVLDELRQIAANRYVSPEKTAQVHVGLGERANALNCLEEACAGRAADLAWLGVRPVFAGLRTEPRFQTLLAQVGI
jgi:eukaryotic-like serine/threonine-protein kinase